MSSYVDVKANKHNHALIYDNFELGSFHRRQSKRTHYALSLEKFVRWVHGR